MRKMAVIKETIEKFGEGDNLTGRDEIEREVYWDMGRAMLFILYTVAMFFLLFLIKLCCAGLACAKVISVVDDKGKEYLAKFADKEEIKELKQCDE